MRNLLNLWLFLLCIAIGFSSVTAFAQSPELVHSESSFKDMKFHDEVVTLNLHNQKFEVVLNGFIRVSAEGLPSGSVTAIYEKDGIAVIKAYPGLGLTVEIPKYGEDRDFNLLMGTKKMIAIGDTRITPTDAHESLITDLTSKRNLANWDESSEATLTILAVTQTDAWVENTATAREMQAKGPVMYASFWCDATAFGAATLIATAAAGGCIALLAPCAAATAITFGGMAVPCGLLEGLCIGGVFSGFAAAYELTRDLWNP